MAPVSAVIIMGKISDRKKDLQPPEGNNFVALVTVVYYLYRMKMFFPGEPPLVYQPENIMAWILQVNT